MELLRKQFRETKESQSYALTAGLKITVIGMVVNLVLIGIKFWGGVAGHSQALIADAVHSISDLLTDGIVILGLKWGRLDADENHPYGHARIETITGLIIGIALVFVAFWIVYHALQSIRVEQTSSPTLMTLMVAAISIFSKEVLYRYTVGIGRRLRSPSLLGNAWHHRSDALSSVAVLIGVGTGYFNPNWRIADVYAALIVAAMIARVGTSLVWQAAKEVVDTAPDHEFIPRLGELARSVEGVREVHDIRARQSGPQILADLHVVVNPDLTVREGHAIARRVKRLLLDNIDDLTSVIIHIDPDRKESS